MSDTAPHHDISDDDDDGIAADETALVTELYSGARTNEESDAIEAKNRRNDKVLAAKLRKASDDERKAKMLAGQAANSGMNRKARTAARKAAKTGVTEMPTAAVKTEKTNIVPLRPAALWTADMAVDAIKSAKADGYAVVTIMPHTLKNDTTRKSAGKVPSRCERGQWGGWKDWAAEALTASVDQLTDWQSQTNSVPNVGNVCGIEVEGGYLSAADIDCEAQEIVDGIAKLAGDTPIAIRKGRTDRSGVIMIVVDELGGTENFQCGGPTHKIQLLRTGKQFVCAGIHPDTKRPYVWQDTFRASSSST
jgi:hypothetical protein